MAGRRGLLAVDAVSWLMMFGCLSLIRGPIPDGEGRRVVSLGSLQAGWRFVFGNAVIFPLLVMDFGANIFGSIRALLPVYARDILMVGPQGLGVLYAASAAGALLGAAGFNLVGQVRRAGAWILIGVFVYAISIVLFAKSHSFWLSVLLSSLPVSATPSAPFSAPPSINSIRPRTNSAGAWRRSTASLPIAGRGSGNFNSARSPRWSEPNSQP